MISLHRCADINFYDNTHIPKGSPVTLSENESDSYVLPLKRQTKIADDILIFCFYLWKKIRLEFSTSSLIFSEKQ